MKKNMGNTDRIIRGVIGIVLVVIGGMVLGIWWGIALFILGLILLLTAIIGICPLYYLFKISTLKK